MQISHERKLSEILMLKMPVRGAKKAQKVEKTYTDMHESSANFTFR